MLKDWIDLINMDSKGPKTFFKVPNDMNPSYRFNVTKPKIPGICRGPSYFLDANGQFVDFIDFRKAYKDIKISS